MRSQVFKSTACLFLGALGSINASTRCSAAAINDVKIVVSSTDLCDRFPPSPKSFVVYAQNTKTAKPISGTFQYDSAPTSQSFQLYDANFIPFTDRFPKSLVIRIAAGATVAIGCTYNVRPSLSPQSVTSIPIVITLTGASYVDPSKPNPPVEDARSFTAFFVETGFSACPAGARPAGLFFLLNLHPYATLNVIVNITASSGPSGPTGPIQLDATPLSGERVSCSNGVNSPIKLAKATLTYPPGQGAP